MLITMTQRLAAAGLLTLGMVSTVGVAAPLNAPHSLMAKDYEPLLLPAADRTRVPSRAPDARRPPIGMPGWPGVRIFVPPDLFEKKAKIPAPIHCIAPGKTSSVDVSPMSQLPPPGLCTGKQVDLTIQVVGGGVPRNKDYETVTKKYCISCKYAGSFIMGTFYPYTAPDQIPKKAACYACKGGYVYSKSKKLCCKNPNK